MLKKLRKWFFDPTTFEQTVLAPIVVPLRILLLLLLAISITATIWIATTSGNTTDRFDHLFTIIGGATISLVSIGLLVLLQKKQIAISSLLLPLAVWLIMTLWLYTGSGARTTTVSGYFLVILVSSLSTKTYSSIIYGLLCIASLVGAFYLQNRGILNITPKTMHLFDLVGPAVALGITSILVYLAKRSFFRAFVQAQQDEHAMAQKTHALEAEVTERKKIEAALQESEERFRSMFENTMIGMYRTMPDGKILMANPALIRMLGYTSFEELAQLNLETGHSYAPTYPRTAFKERVEREGQIAGVETAWIRRNGETIFIRESAHVIRDESGNALYYEGTVEDITDRIKAEQALQQRTEQLEALRQVSLELGAQLDLDALLQSIVSRAIELLNGTAGGLYLYRPEQDLLEWSISVGPDLPPIGSTLHKGEGLSGKVWKTGKPLIVNDYWTWQGRSHIFNGYGNVATIGALVQWGDEFLGVVNVLAPVPHTFSPSDAELLDLFAVQAGIAIRNARLYKQTRRRAERLTVVNRVSEAVGATLDLDRLMDTVYHEITSLFEADAFFIALYDHAENELNFRILVDQGVKHPTEQQPLGTGLTSLVVNEKRALYIENLEQKLDRLPKPEMWGNDRLPTSWLGVPMLIGERLVGVLNIQTYHPRSYSPEEQLLLATIADQVALAVERAQLHDQVRQELAKRERLEAQLVQAQKMEAIGRLAGGVAHDFNNLLTAITGYTDLLLNRFASDPQTQPDLTEIKKAADRAAMLTHQLLAFSRKQIMQPEALDLNEIIADIREMLQRLIGEDIELSTFLSPNLGLVRVDPGQIHQVIMNLAVNARDAMPQGGRLIIETDNVELDETYADQHLDATPGKFIRLTVSDTGIGMDQATQQHLFEPFFTTKGVGKGTGLGLATVHGIVKQSGGNVYVYSEPGEGTTFKIYLPIVQETDPAEHLSSAFPTPEHGNETILLVEDAKMVRNLTRRILQKNGYTVLQAQDAHQAVQVCEQHAGPIHLLLTDVVMPGGVNGRELAQQLVKRYPAIRTLYISGYTENTIAHHGVIDRGIHFLPKPFSPNELAHKVRQILDQDLVPQKRIQQEKA